MSGVTPIIDKRSTHCPTRWRATSDGNLAVVLLTRLTAVLTHHAYRMFAFLGETGVADDPIMPGIVDQQWFDVITHRCRYDAVLPRRLRHYGGIDVWRAHVTARRSCGQSEA